MPRLMLHNSIHPRLPRVVVPLAPPHSGLEGVAGRELPGEMELAELVEPAVRWRPSREASLPARRR